MRWGTYSKIITEAKISERGFIMKKAVIIVLVVLAVMIAAAAVGFGAYCYKNLHWYDRYEKALKSVNAVERQFTLPSGRAIN